MYEHRLDYKEIKERLDTCAAFRLLRKDGAAFMLGFLYEQFKARNRSDIGQSELTSALSTYAELVRLAGQDETPGWGESRRDTSSYLDEWANEGFLRKFYPEESDEASFDLTPDSERVLEWLAEMSRRGFIGTESRLKALLDAIRDLAYGAAFDPEERKAELLRQKAAIDAELGRLDRGEAATLDDTRIKERYYGVEDAARRLLADFKQIEQNFRDLDRETKERIIAAEGSRGRVLKDLFEHRDVIMASDQGKSFQAFWAYLMSIDTRDELSTLIGRVLSLEAIKDSKRSLALESLDAWLVAAGARVQRMTWRLNEELRRFLDDRSRLQVRMATRLIEEYKRLAMALKDSPPTERDFMVLEGDPDLGLVMDRPFYRPEEQARITETPSSLGEPASQVDVLYELDDISLAELAERLRRAIAEDGQASLGGLALRWPARHGSAELVGYLRLASMAPELAEADRRTRIEAYNERTSATVITDCPDPIFLTEVEP